MSSPSPLPSLLDSRTFYPDDWAYSDASSPASSSGRSSALPSTPPSTEFDSDSSSSKSSPKGYVHIPRPRNAFIIFRSYYYLRAKATQTDINQNSLSCAAASAWKALSDEEKRPYRRQAEDEKLTHYKKHPNYVYTPINKAVKRAQRKARTTSSKKPSAPKPRSSLARRAVARNAKTKEIPSRPVLRSASKSRRDSPALDASGALSFVPLDDIPPLDLAQVAKSEDAECSVLFPSYEPVDSQFGLRPDLATSTLPPMPFPENDKKMAFPDHPIDTSYPNWVSGDYVHDTGIHAGWNPIQTTLDAYGDCSVFDGYKEPDTSSQYDAMDTPFQCAVYPIFSQDGVWTGL
ncbi:hypothetical protein APHAL10511_006760 [Amanita phalloides]|nr:hypothetical protein APHAL10511_006760 [Amanita phalloides]